VYERIIRKRKRKSSDQLKTLMREFDRNPNWSKETLLEVSRKTGLSEAQVYKWGWDQKRKKYGPELAALMMPPFESLGDVNHPFMGMEGATTEQLAYHYKMMKEAGELQNHEFDNDGLFDDEEDSNEDEGQKRQLPIPTPFPNEALLDKLSSKLAQEEEEQSKKRLNLKESKDQKKGQQVGSPVMMFKVDDASKAKKAKTASPKQAAKEETKAAANQIPIESLKEGASPSQNSEASGDKKRALKTQAKDAKK